MKNFILLATLSILTLSSCLKSDLPNDTPQCIIDEIKDFKSSEYNCEGAIISSYDFQGETVYVFQEGLCFSDSGAKVLDSECTQICYLGGIAGLRNCEGINFYSNVTNQVVLWKR